MKRDRRRISTRQGVDDEPHLAGSAPEPDDSNRLDEEPARASDAPPQPVDHSAADEPALAWSTIDRATVPGFSEHLDVQLARTGPGLRLAVAAGVVLLAGPFAIFGAFLEGLTTASSWLSMLYIIVIGPVTEEMLKVAIILYLAERRPWLLAGAGAVVAMGAAGGLAFAAIENVFYIYVYYPEAGPELAVARWTMAAPMHVVCSTIAGVGIARMWLFTMRERQWASPAVAFPFLVAAMVIHGLYNLTVSLVDVMAWF